MHVAIRLPPHHPQQVRPIVRYQHFARHKHIDSDASRVGQAESQGFRV